jgi:hypothetical protein
LTAAPRSLIVEPRQITDGILKMFIEELKPICHLPGDYVDLTIMYENMSSRSLVLVDHDAVTTAPIISHGMIFPVLSTVDGIRLRFEDDLSNMDLLINTDSPKLKEVAANTFIEFKERYYLSHASGSVGEAEQFTVLPPGHYLLKYVYAATDYPDAWQGQISSNSIVVCIR